MKRLKALAMYLPQFHRLPENDAWWGEGFTEWTAVKKAEKLFEGQHQIREPLNENYYDLMKKETMEWQADLAKKYGVDGFCFYHYYFKNGRQILEKPAENLLQWKDIDMPFCFCWANEAWARSWSNISNINTWSEKFEKKNHDEKTILLEQDYGEKEDWIKHFEYLFPFFEDHRYIKVDGKPVFMFYKPEEINVLSEMIMCWQTLIKERGYEGIYTIGVNISKKIENLDAILYQGPAAYRLPHILGKKVPETWEFGIRAYEYSAIWENAIGAASNVDGKVYYGGFVDYDDTPRRGKLGSCTLNVTPQIFETYLYKLAVKNIALDNEFLFINAWNEWGEGNYLEPDKKNGYQFLEAVQRVMRQCNSADFDAKIIWRDIEKKYKHCVDDIEKQALISDLNKFRNYYKLLDRWLLLKEQNQKIEQYFIENGYQRVVIYGFAALGKHLYEELRDSSVEVVCALDRRQGLNQEGITVQSVEQGIPDCDVIVVTATYDYEQIAKKLKEVSNVAVVSLQDVILEER